MIAKLTKPTAYREPNPGREDSVQRAEQKVKAKYAELPLQGNVLGCVLGEVNPLHALLDLQKD